MKKYLSILLGLSLFVGAATVSFAQDKDGGDKKDGKKKGKKKKEGDRR